MQRPKKRVPDGKVLTTTKFARIGVSGGVPDIRFTGSSLPGEGGSSSSKKHGTMRESTQPSPEIPTGGQSIIEEVV